MKFGLHLIREAEKNEKKLVNFFQKIVDHLDADGYKKKYLGGNLQISKYILLFYCLPKTKLHKQFREQILDKLEDDFDFEKELLEKLEKNTLSAKYNELTKQEFFQDETRNVMYKPFKKLNADGENLIYVGIPYEFQEKGKPPKKKFAYIEIISKIKTPIRYAFFDDRFL